MEVPGFVMIVQTGSSLGLMPVRFGRRVVGVEKQRSPGRQFLYGPAAAECADQLDARQLAPGLESNRRHLLAQQLLLRDRRIDSYAPISSRLLD